MSPNKLMETILSAVLPEGCSRDVLLIIPIMAAVFAIGIACWISDSKDIHSRQLNGKYSRAIEQYDSLLLNYLALSKRLGPVGPNRNHEYVETSTRYDNFSFKPIRVPKRSMGETECMLVLEELFNTKFHTVRPFFLKFPETGRNLELDCYNSELRLAVEYMGSQHYRWPSFPGFTREQFYSQHRRDHFKIEKCNEYGIHLITVPYTVKLEDIRNYILEKIPYRLDIYLCY